MGPALSGAKHKEKIMAVLKNAAPVHESAGGSGAWSRVEMWVLGLAIALVIASVALGPALAHAGR